MNFVVTGKAVEPRSAFGYCEPPCAMSIKAERGRP
jgi:hypothetical protein